MELRAVELPPRAPGLDRTLVLFHGFGADEHDLLSIGHELDPRLRVVSLQAPSPRPLPRVRAAGGPPGSTRGATVSPPPNSPTPAPGSPPYSPKSVSRRARRGRGEKTNNFSAVSARSA